MFGDLKTAAGVKALDTFLADNCYIEGLFPSQADIAVLEAMKGTPGSDTLHAHRWYNHIKSFAVGMKQFAKARKDDTAGSADMDANIRYDHLYETPNENILEKKTDKKTDWMKRMGSAKVKTEQEKIVEQMKKVTNFLEHVPIMNEESLKIISKPWIGLLSSLKYLPIQSFFTNLPVEIKTGILSYLCDSGAFIAASVCQEWRDLLVKERLNKFKKVTIGKCCSNKYSCHNRKCFKPKEMLEASITLKLNIPMVICYPVTNVDSKLLAEGLMSVSDFTITDDDVFMNMKILTKDQTRELFESLENESKLESQVRSIQLRGLDMTHLDQDRLINCLLLKTNNLSLAQGLHCSTGPQKNILDFKMLIYKLLEVPIKFRVSHLHLEYMEYREDSDVDLANALCRVKSVTLGKSFLLSCATTKRLIKNILNLDRIVQPSRIETLLILDNMNWRSLITPKDLKIFITKMGALTVKGRFTLEQRQAAMSLPGVQVSKISNTKYTRFKISKV